jgi:hypothetical protein
VHDCHVIGIRPGRSRRRQRGKSTTADECS